MIDSAILLTGLKRELKALEADLRARADEPRDPWGDRLRKEYEVAKRRERTGLSWIAWRDGEVSQAAVAWILACVFVRFSEDNALLAGAQRDGRPVSLPWITAPGDGLERAVENEQAFYAATPTATSRDWLQDAFRTLADLPAGRPLVDPHHSAVWNAPISAAAADALVAFFRRTTPSGELVHDFGDTDLDTRFLGDLYQDLSDYAKKTFALLQTPEFVEEFILDQTLTPAIGEFGLTGLKLIDPACGSGHFLLGAFNRLRQAWAEAAPGLDKGERVQRALDSIHGVDLNPFAIAIARFRLTVAAIQAAGIRTLTAAPAFRFHLAIGDSLLGSVNRSTTLDLGDGEYFAYDAEDLREYVGILAPDQYHVVVANPPYIQPPDAKLRDQYRGLYSTCHGKYALSVPFMELLFRLAKRPNGGGAGYVGQITSNSFMKREFGKRLIEHFLSGIYTGIAPDHVELTHIIDTSGAYIPGHGTPTVILIGRPRKPQSDTVRAVLGLRGEPDSPEIPSDGRVWREITLRIDEPGFVGAYVSVEDQNRSYFETHPWSLSGGGATKVMDQLRASPGRLQEELTAIGYSSITGDDEFLIAPVNVAQRLVPEASPYVIGASIRDYTFTIEARSMVPAERVKSPTELLPQHFRWLWAGRTVLSNRLYFGRKPTERGLPWWSYAIDFPERSSVDFKIVYSNMATHNQFAIDRSRAVFNAHGQVIIPKPDSDGQGMLGVLNSSAACFWLKQVSHNKGDSTDSRGARVTGDPAFDTYEFTGTKLQELPMPAERASDLALRLDETARARADVAPAAVLATSGTAAMGPASAEWVRLGRELTALQEELDWRMYVAYGLADASLASETTEIVPIYPNERAFEIKLARAVLEGASTTAWFDRHGRTPLTEFPSHWPKWYEELAERRLEAMESSPSLRLLEQPEYKRRWAGATWEQLVANAVQTALLDRLESPELWQDEVARPLVRSVAQLADMLRRDETFRELLTIHTGSQDYDLTTEVGRLLAGDAVPGLAALRYKPSGIEKFRAWEHTWDLQRAEDRGERVEVPVPPNYAPADFLKPSYWSARGKLDVPKERFVSFPGSKLPDDATELYGWAGWDHGARGQATARLANDLSRTGAHDETVVPLVGSLIELEPWLMQWYGEVDPRTGVSPATAVGGVVTALLGRLGVGRDDILAWRPPTVARGRRSAS